MIIIGPNLSLFIEYRFKEYFLSNTGYGVFSHRKHSTFCFLTKKTFTKTFFAFLLLLNFYFCPSEIFFQSSVGYGRKKMNFNRQNNKNDYFKTHVQIMSI